MHTLLLLWQYAENVLKIDNITLIWSRKLKNLNICWRSIGRWCSPECHHPRCIVHSLIYEEANYISNSYQLPVSSLENTYKTVWSSTVRIYFNLFNNFWLFFTVTMKNIVENVGKINITKNVHQKSIKRQSLPIK